MAADRISIAMCTCNGGAWVGEQLESIAAQSLPPDELVVCDDASEDDTPAVVERFARGAGFAVKMFRNPRRLGVTKNFEQAVSRCTGDVIFLADQDDVWARRKIQMQAGLLSETLCAAAFSDGEVVDENLDPVGYTLWQSVWFNRHEQAEFADGRGIDVLAKHAVAVGATLAFRSAYRDILLPIPDLRTAHDIWISTLLAAVADVRPIPQPLIRYRLHGKNAVGLKNWNLREQVAKAREQVAVGAFAHAVELYGAVGKRLEAFSDHYTVAPHAGRTLAEKVEHSRLRDEMPERWVSRLPVVLREINGGRYSRYSYGWKSVAQDLFLR